MDAERKRKTPRPNSRRGGRTSQKPPHTTLERCTRDTARLEPNRRAERRRFSRPPGGRSFASAVSKPSHLAKEFYFDATARASCYRRPAVMTVAAPAARCRIRGPCSRYRRGRRRACKSRSSRFRTSQSLPSCLYGPEASGAARGGSETWWQRVAPFPVAETSVRKVTPLLVFVPRFGSANWVLNSWSQGRCFSFARDSETVPAGTLGRSESQRRAIDACVPLSATLSPSIDFPLTRLYDLVCSSDFLAGASWASPVAWHVLVTVLSLSPRRDQDAASVRFRHPMLPSPFLLRARLPDSFAFEASSRSLSLRPGD